MSTFREKSPMGLLFFKQQEAEANYCGGQTTRS